MSARARSSDRSEGIDAHRVCDAMTAWSKFLDTFFNAKVMAHYLPDILAGTLLTIELAVL